MPKKQIEIAGMTFSSKTAVRKYLSGIFMCATSTLANGKRAILNGDEEKFVRELVKMHPEYAPRVAGREIVGCEIKFAKVNGPNKTRKTIAHLIFVDGSTVHFRTYQLISKL